MSSFSARRGVQHYRKLGLQAQVSEASPHQLISLLLDGARHRIGVAHACLSQAATHQADLSQIELARKGKAITEACAIIAHLNDTLDHAAGGDIAANLSALYDWLLQQLTLANVENDANALQQSLEVLGDIQSAWNAIASHPASMRAA